MEKTEIHVTCPQTFFKKKSSYKGREKPLQ